MNTNAPQDGDGRDLAPIERLGRLYVAVVSDALDALGYKEQVMDLHIRPLAPGMKVAGTAATMTAVVVDRAPEDPADAYRGELEAIDSLRPGDVAVVHSGPGAAVWGQLTSTAARRRGAAGFVGDAYARDVRQVVEMGFPTFVAGIDARDSNGRLEVTAVGEPIVCGGVSVAPGDLVLADDDGVIVIPRAVAERTIAAAEVKVGREREMDATLDEGMPLPDAFSTFGVL